MNELNPLASNEVSRRSLLQLIGLAAGGGALLTACQGGGGAASGSGQRLFRAGYPYDAPPKGNFNLLPGVPEAITLGYLYDLVLLPGAMYFWDSQKYFYLLADPSSKLSADGTTLTYKVRPGLKWSDGKPVTAQDVYTTWTLQYVLGNPAFNYVDKITKTDSTTVTFHMKSPAPIAQYYLMRGQIVSDAVYGQFMAEAGPLVTALASSTDQRMVKLNQKIASFKPKTVTASGPFNFDMGKVGDQQLTLVKNKTGYKADTVNFDTITVANGETEVVTPLVLAKKIDYATHGFPVASAQEFSTQGFRIILSSPTYDGDGLFFNFGKHPEFADKRVRQALAYAIDRAQAGQASLGAAGKPVKFMTGISDVMIAKYLSPADRSKLNTYDHDLAKAAQLLSSAGWKKQGGMWMTPQGKPAAYTVTYASQYANKAAGAQNIQSQLNAFGFKLTLLGEDSTQLPVDMTSGKFDLAVQSWGSSRNPYPTDSFAADIETYNYPTSKPGRGMDFPQTQDTQSVGRIDFETAIPDSGRGATVQALSSKVTRLAIAFNELLPVLPAYGRYTNNPVNTANISGYPADNDPIYKNSTYADNFTTILMYQGTLKPAN
jgi:peptide/nickel transport system substrate-binding protein